MMRLKIFVGLIMISSASFAIAEAAKAVSNETLLRRHLFIGCDCHVRPVSKWTDTLIVYLDYSPLYIHELDGVRQMFSVYGWLGTKWQIPLLTWDPKEYGEIKYLTLTAQDIWFPNLGVLNSVDDLYGDNFRIEDRQGKLYNDGIFRINRPGTWNTICMIDVTYFPFDEQVCHIEIDSWTIPLPELRLEGNGSKIKMGKMRPNGQWTVVDSWIHVEHTTSTSSSYQTLSFVFRLKRKPQFIAINFMLPCMGILLLEVIIFMIPPDAGEKISLGITLLLAQTVFQLVMHEDMPETSDQFPVINLYILLAMILSGLQIVCSVVVLNFHHRPYRNDMCPRTGRIILGHMARALGVRMSKPRKQSRREWSNRYHSNHIGNGHVAEAEKEGRDEEEEAISWINVARVLDRLFFYLFLCLTVGISFTCILVSYFSHKTNNRPLAGYGYNYNPT